MQKLKDSASKQLEINPRSKIIKSYLATIEDSFRENRPQIKLINYGTGSGKTHQLFGAICETIARHSDVQIIGVYVAPLREHLQVPDAIVNQYPHIPIYKLNSLEMKTTDEFIKLYKNWILSILKNKNFWKISAKEHSREKVQEAQHNLKKLKGIINRLEFIKNIDFGDEEFRKVESGKAIYALNNLIEKFLEFLVKSKLDEDSWPIECLKLVEIFVPLHLLREKS